MTRETGQYCHRCGHCHTWFSNCGRTDAIGDVHGPDPSIRSRKHPPSDEAEIERRRPIERTEHEHSKKHDVKKQGTKQKSTYNAALKQKTQQEILDEEIQIRELLARVEHAIQERDEEDPKLEEEERIKMERDAFIRNSDTYNLKTRLDALHAELKRRT